MYPKMDARFGTSENRNERLGGAATSQVVGSADAGKAGPDNHNVKVLRRHHGLAHPAADDADIPAYHLLLPHYRVARELAGDA